jgi:hypothetical protein
MQVSFGAGLLAFTPPGANPTPVVCGVLQDVSLKATKTLKKLYGQKQWPAAVAEGEGSITGTAKFAQIYGSFLKNALNGSISTGQTIGAINEAATIPGTPYTVTVVNSATWVADFSVYDYTASKPMTLVASGPAAGQYSVSAGVYTFAAADTGHSVGINYSYTSTGGQTVKVTNALMGAASTFTAALFNNYNGLNSGVKLYAVALAGIDFAIKNTDFTIQNLQFEGFADSLDRVIDTYTAE